MLIFEQWCVQTAPDTWKAEAGGLFEAQNTEMNNRTRTWSQKNLCINYVKTFTLLLNNAAV